MPHRELKIKFQGWRFILPTRPIHTGPRRALSCGSHRGWPPSVTPTQFCTLNNQQRRYLPTQTDLFQSLKGSMNARIISVVGANPISLFLLCAMFDRSVETRMILRESSSSPVIKHVTSYSAMSNLRRFCNSFGTCHRISILSRRYTRASGDKGAVWR